MSGRARGTARPDDAASSLLGDYLRARRAVLQPEDVGLLRGERRRVGGLRRQEVAKLAGISTEYYLRLEQGRDRQPSDQVVAALAGALQVGEFGLRHMRRLVLLQQANADRARRPVSAASVHPLLDFWPRTPVAVVDANLDVLTSNGIAQALDGELLTPGANLLIGIFDRSDPDSPAWLAAAERGVAALRFRCDPDDPRLQDVVGRLSVRHPLFRRMWARHDSRPWPEGVVRSPVRGRGLFAFRFQTLDLPTLEGCSVVAFSPADPAADEALSAVAVELDRSAFPRSASA
jgi:transcriptional regulator with XRE-family HTH domain